MSDTGSPSEPYETQFLEGLYIAVRTRGVPIYKVFLLLILFVYSFLFYFILFCFAFIMPLIIVTYKGSFTDSWVRISVLVSKGRYFSLSTISVVLSLSQIFTLTTLFQLMLWCLSDLHLLNNGAKLNNISKIVVLFIPFYWGHFSTAGEGVSRYLLTLGGRPRVRYFIHRRTCRGDYLPYSS